MLACSLKVTARIGFHLEERKHKVVVSIGVRGVSATYSALVRNVTAKGRKSSLYVDHETTVGLES